MGTRYRVGLSTEILHLEAGSGIVFERDGTVLRILGGSTGVPFTGVIQSLGAARRSGTFDLTGLADLPIGHTVMVQHTAAAVPSKGHAQDEPEMDLVQATGYVLNATTIRVSWQAPSVVVGDVAFAYAVAA